MKLLQPLFLVMLFLFSCAKEGKNIYIEGRVINPETGEGIPNVKTKNIQKKRIKSAVFFDT